MKLETRFLALFAVMCVGCASGSLFHSGPRPSQLVGTWIDSATSTPADSSAWVLKSNGDYRMLKIRGRRDDREPQTNRYEDHHYAQWYLSGSLADTSRREFCFKRRARNGGSCMRFQLDTLPSGQRRLRMLGYANQAPRRVWVLTERLTQ